MLRLRPLLLTLAVVTCPSASAQTYDVTIREEATLSMARGIHGSRQMWESVPGT